MVTSGKMKSYCVSFLVVSDIEKVATKSLCHCVSGLTYILFVAGFACYAVDKVGAFAAYVVFARVGNTCSGTLKSVFLVQEGAKLAFFVGACPSVCGLCIDFGARVALSRSCPV